MSGDPSLIKWEVGFQLKYCNNCYSFHSTHYQGTGGLWKPGKHIPEELCSHEKLFLPITDRNPMKTKTAWEVQDPTASHSMLCLGEEKPKVWFCRRGKPNSIQTEPHPAFQNCSHFSLTRIWNITVWKYLRKNISSSELGKTQNIIIQSKLILCPKERRQQ